MTYNELCKKYRDIQEHSDLLCDLRLVVSSVLSIDYSEVNQFLKIDEVSIKKIDKLMAKHLKGKPLQKVLGYSMFYDCYIGYSDKTLTPRMETEILVSKVVEYIGNKKLRVLDLCAGSGCIGIAIAKNTKAEVVSADISKHAIKEIKNNAKHNAVDLDVIKSDMFDSIRERFDIIVCNPPYIPKEEYISLDKLVKKYDPKIALVAENNGLKFYEILASESNKYLKSGGKIFLEIGYNQGESVIGLFKQDYKDIELIKDYSDNDRIVIAGKKGE